MGRNVLTDRGSSVPLLYNMINQNVTGHEGY